MTSCIIITSHLSNPHKEQIALELLDFLKDKNLPIIFVGNYKIPEEVQEKADWVLYTKENPKANRAMRVWSQIRYNPKLKVNAQTPDHGYAHLLQAYRGFKLAESLGYDHGIHINYDLDLDDKGFKDILNQIQISPNLTNPWAEEGCATNFYCFIIEDFISAMEITLPFYLNNNPPNIKEGWYCEIFFKWALEYANIDYTISKLKFEDKINEEFCYIDNNSFKVYGWEEQNEIILYFEHGVEPNPNNLKFLFNGKVFQASLTPHPRYFTLPFQKGKYYNKKGDLIFNLNNTHLSRFKVLPMD
jgi:hypothetical protein